MNALLLTQPKQLRHVIHLQQCFTAADRNTAAVFPVAVIPPCLSEGFRRRLPIGAFCRISPGFRIMAVLTPHPAALKKNNIADPRPVHRAEGLYAVDISLNHK